MTSWVPIDLFKRIFHIVLSLENSVTRYCGLAYDKLLLFDII